MEQQEAPLTVGSDIMLKRGWFSLFKVLKFGASLCARVYCVSVCVCCRSALRMSLCGVKCPAGPQARLALCCSPVLFGHFITVSLLMSL